MSSGDLARRGRWLLRWPRCVAVHRCVRCQATRSLRRVLAHQLACSVLGSAVETATQARWPLTRPSAQSDRAPGSHPRAPPSG